MITLAITPTVTARGLRNRSHLLDTASNEWQAMPAKPEETRT